MYEIGKSLYENEKSPFKNVIDLWDQEITVYENEKSPFVNKKALCENEKSPFENVIDLWDQDITIYENEKSPFEKERCSNMKAKHDKSGMSSNQPFELREF